MCANYWLLAHRTVFVYSGTQCVSLILRTQFVCYFYKEHSLSFHHFDNTMSLPQFHNKVCVPYLINDWNVCHSLININVAELNKRFISSVNGCTGEIVFAFYFLFRPWVPIATLLINITRTFKKKNSLAIWIRFPFYSQ